MFDEAWHAAAIVEMTRVAREVRVFPLLHQGAGQPIAFLTSLRRALEGDAGLATHIVAVPYAFQIGGHEMLVVAGAP